MSVRSVSADKAIDGRRLIITNPALKAVFFYIYRKFWLSVLTLRANEKTFLSDTIKPAEDVF